MERKIKKVSVKPKSITFKQDVEDIRWLIKTMSSANKSDKKRLLMAFKSILNKEV